MREDIWCIINMKLNYLILKNLFYYNLIKNINKLS